MANAQLHLESAYKNFFRRPKVGYPKYKSKHKGKRRYTTNYVNGNIRVEDGYITLPKIRNIRIKAHREIPEGYRMKSVTVEKRASGNYYVSILCEYEAEVKEKEITVGWEYTNEVKASANYTKVSPFTVGENFGTIVENVIEKMFIYLASDYSGEIVETEPFPRASPRPNEAPEFPPP